MSVQPFVLGPDQHDPALNVVGTQVTVLASNLSECPMETSDGGFEPFSQR